MWPQVPIAGLRDMGFTSFAWITPSEMLGGFIFTQVSTCTTTQLHTTSYLKRGVTTSFPPLYLHVYVFYKLSQFLNLRAAVLPSSTKMRKHHYFTP